MRASAACRVWLDRLGFRPVAWSSGKETACLVEELLTLGECRIAGVAQAHAHALPGIFDQG
jgi:hypothetical protein